VTISKEETRSFCELNAQAMGMVEFTEYLSPLMMAKAADAMALSR
jgi:hypothetical protein